MPLRLGDPLPEVTLVDHAGRTWRTTDHAGRPLVLMLHRHLACLPCQEHLRQLRDRQAELGDAEIVVVAFADVDRLAAYRDHLQIPFTIVADPDRRLYQLLGAVRGTRRQVWSLGTLRMYVRLLRAGRRLRRPTEDIYQLGADAVVGRDGRLRYVSLPPSPDTRPPIDDLVAALG